MTTPRAEFADFLHIIHMPIMLWDLDSSLCDTRQRWGMIPAIKRHEKTWDDYSMACIHDAPIPGPIALMQQMSAHGHVALSARSECALVLSWKWMRENDVPLDGMILRPTGSRLNAGIWKVSKIRRLRKAGFSVVGMADDQADIARRIYHQTGVPVVGLNPFYEDGYAMKGAI